MSEHTPETPETPAQAPEGADNPKPETPAKPEPDWKAEARKWEQRAKENTAAAKRLQEIEDQNKTEAERNAERLSAAEKRAQEAEAKVLKRDVADAKGLTPAQAKYLTGTTQEELEASADQILEDFPAAKPGPTPQRKPQERLRGGVDPEETPEETDPDKLAAAISRG